MTNGFIRINHDQNIADIMDGINEILEKHGIQFVCDDQEHDGCEIYELIVRKPTKRLVKGKRLATVASREKR